MAITLSFIGGCFCSGHGYIYVLYSKTHHSLYVGQTNDKCGVVGRLNSHVNNKGTFRRRLLEREGINLDKVDDLQVFSYTLPLDARFVGIDRTFREGVEYLVQKSLHEVCGSINPFMRIVSHVEYNDSAQLTFVRYTAQEIFEAFLNTF